MDSYAKNRVSTGLKILYACLMGLCTLAIGTLMGFIGGANEGYHALNRPPLTPPDAVFPIVWSVLYFLMGIAFYLLVASTPVNKEAQSARTAGIILFAIQFVVNIVWPIIFFRADMYLFAFIWLAVLDALVVSIISVSFKVSKWCAIIHIAYLAWLLFATYLNLMILIYN